MYLDSLERAKAQSIAFYVCNGQELLSVKERNYEERVNLIFDQYRENCRKFADKVCDSMVHYKRLDDHAREMLINDFTHSLDCVLADMETLFCELGIRIGFNLALDLGLDAYKARRRI